MKTVKYFILGLIGCLFINVYAADVNDNVCKTYLSNAQFNKASSCYHALIKQDSNNAFYYFNYANSLFMQKRYNEAKVQYNIIITKFPNTNIASASRKNLQLTNEKLREITTNKVEDSGNYLSDIKVGRWETMPIRVWIQSGQYNVVAKRAFLEWQNKTSGKVKFTFVDKINAAQLTVFFDKELPKSSTGGDPLGVTYTSSNPSTNKILAGEMHIKSTTKTGVVQTPAQIYPVILHEVGHAVGIKGHSRNKYDVMYVSDDNYRNVLSNRDINTVIEIYK